MCFDRIQRTCALPKRKLTYTFYHFEAFISYTWQLIFNHSPLSVLPLIRGVLKFVFIFTQKELDWKGSVPQVTSALGRLSFAVRGYLFTFVQNICEINIHF